MLFTYKLLVGGLILLVALIFGLLPILWRADEKTAHFLHYGESFARGIFLGAGFIHLLPSALTDFAMVSTKFNYPVILTSCAFVIFTLFFIEQGLSQRFARQQTHPSKWLPYLLMVMLSIHSFIEGMALGVTSTLVAFLLLFFAIIAHKGAESFAVGINLRTNQLAAPRQWQMIVVFALMTPIGLLLGSSIQQLLQANSSHIAEAFFNTLAAGTFIYIATFSHRHHTSDESNENMFHHTLFVACGLIIMAVLAIWV